MCKNNSEEKMPKSCQEISRYSDKLQYNEATFWEKLKLKLHISYCKRCHEYNTKNSLLTNLFKKNKYKALDFQDLQSIKDKVSADK